MKVVILAGRRLGYFLGRSFEAKRHHVTLMSGSKEVCEFLARRLSCLVLHGDPTDPATMVDAGMRSAAAFVAATDKDEDNLVACQMAKDEFSVPRAIAIVNDPDNVEAFSALGVEAFSATEVVVGLVEQRAALDAVTYLSSLAEGRVAVAELVLDASAPCIGRKLREIHLPANTLVASIISGGQLIVPRGETILTPGDKLTLLALPRELEPAILALAGDH